MSAVLSILRLLVHRRILLTRQIAADTNITAEYVRQACKQLAKHGFITSADGLHEVTEKGRDALKTGKITHLRKGTAAISHSKTLRQKAWYHMRTQPIFTVNSLLALAASGHEKSAKDNLRKYCNALCAVGILGKTARRGGYFLQGNTGKMCPTWNKIAKTVTDRNTGEVFSYE